MRLLYFDCISGVSGDMILGALVDAGVPEIVLTDAIDALDVGEWDVEVEHVERAGVTAAKARVIGTDNAPARAYPAIVSLIEGSRLTDAVKEKALMAFARLGEAEARIHHVALDDLHLHEVGAVDAIVDIVCSCAGLAHLGPDTVIASALPSGRGSVRSAHGTIPLPAPAVVEILRDIPLYEKGDRELVTPTGAALLATWSESFGPLPAMTVSTVGYGAGDTDLDTPNVLRLLVGDAVEVEPTDGRVELIETNIDDMSPELMPYVIERLLAAGARDAWTEPAAMKKGRSGLRLSAIVEPTATKKVLDVIFKETTTFGVRIGPLRREVLDRSLETVTVGGHHVRVKIGRHDREVVTVSPEYEDAAAVARATGMPLKDVYDQARQAYLSR